MTTRSTVRSLLALAESTLVDTTCEGALAPFWADPAPVVGCMCVTCERVAQEAQDAAYDREIMAQWDNEYAEQQLMWSMRCESMRWMPAPAIVLTGTEITVEWECLERGYRFWERCDAGALDHEVWRKMSSGYLLSDVAS